MAPWVKDHIRRPYRLLIRQTPLFGVARFVKRGKSVRLPSPTLFLLLPANCVFKLTWVAPSTVKYENWHVLNMFTITDENRHFNQAFQADYVAALLLIKVVYCYTVG